MIPVTLTAAVSVTNPTIQKKTYGLQDPLDLAERTTILIISNEEIEDIIKMFKSFQKTRFSIKGLKNGKDKNVQK